MSEWYAWCFTTQKSQQTYSFWVWGWRGCQRRCCWALSWTHGWCTVSWRNAWNVCSCFSSSLHIKCKHVHMLQSRPEDCKFVDVSSVKSRPIYPTPTVCPHVDWIAYCHLPCRDTSKKKKITRETMHDDMM